MSVLRLTYLTQITTSFCVKTSSRFRRLLPREPQRNAAWRRVSEVGPTPPTLLAHALDDKIVSPENSRLFYEALQKQKVPSRYLELPSGDHGLNGYHGPMWDAWQSGSLKWLASLGLIPEKDAGP